MHKTVLVTGSSRGIGKAIALYLASKGYDIVVHCRSRMAEAEAVAEEIKTIGQTARILQFDLSDRKQCAELLNQDVKDNGAYYAVVCNAGISADNAFPALTGAEWDSVIHTNLDGFYNVMHLVLFPMLKEKQGRIIVVSSTSGQIGQAGQVNYSASKAGLIGAAKALAREVGKKNILVRFVMAFSGN